MEYSPEECAENLSAALDAVENYVRLFVRIPESAVPAACAWIAHTYLIDENGFPAGVTPRLGFTSRKRGGGKSTALGVVKRLARNGEKYLLISKAGYMNAIERQRATLCLEEMDKTFPKESSRMDIQAAINAGYEPDGGTIAHGNREVPMHAFVAFAGIGPVLEANPGLEPLWHRTIQVEMEPVFGVRFPEYDSELHGRGTKYLCQVLASAMELASQVYGEGLKSLSPPLLSEMDARRDQIWRVLRRIGMAAGPEWQARIDQSCADMEAGRSGASPVLSQAQRIWPDVRAVTHGDAQIGTQELINRLRALPDTPWSFLWPSATSTGTARELAALLAPHGLVPEKITTVVDGISIPEKGYRLTKHRDCPICAPNALATDERSAERMEAGTERMPVHGTDHTDVHMVRPQHALGEAVPLFTPPLFD